MRSMEDCEHFPIRIVGRYLTKEGFVKQVSIPGVDCSSVEGILYKRYVVEVVR